MNQRTQLFLVHGGMTFKNKTDYVQFLKNRKITIQKRSKWSEDYLTRNLGKTFEIIHPRFPLQDNAKYSDWKIHFERHIPFLRNNVILIGCSLGGIFLAKYLSENKFPKKILATYLVGAPFDDALPSEDLAGGFKLKSDLSMLGMRSGNLTFLFSKDDPVIPLAQAHKYRNKLKNASIIILDRKYGHFNIPEFPELIKMIKKDIKR